MLSHICIVSLNGYAIWNPGSQAQIGGSEVQLHLLGQELVRRGYTVSYVVGDFGQLALEEYRSVKVYRSIRLTKTLTNLIQAPRQLWRALKRVDADVYLSSPAGPEVGIIALFCRLRRKRYVYRTASSVDCTHEKVYALGLFGGMLYRLGLVLATQIVTQSRDDQTQLQRHWRRQSIVIPNGLPISPLPTRVPPSDQYLLWVGSARAVKQPELFLAVARRFPQEPCLMILSAAGGKTRRASIKTEAARLPNVRLLENVSFAESQGYFNKARLYIGTSAYEGFPNVYLQACLAGVPVVSLTVNPDEVITRHGFGAWAKGSLDQLYREVERLLTNPHAYRAASQQARQYVVQRHNIIQVGQAWAELLTST